MPMDTRQKRMSAMNIREPWRGALVDAPESGNTAGNRAAGAFMYSGIVGAAAVSIVVLERMFFRRVFSRIFGRVN